MDSQVVKRLMYSVVQFLQSQLESSSSQLSEEATESVEVAVQCLETAYGLSQESSDLAVSRPLYDIFSDALANENGFTATRCNYAGAKPATQEDKTEAEQLKNEGNLLMREERFREALNCYTKAIEKDDENAVYYCNRAAAHSKLNSHLEAIDDCKKALQIEPQYSKAYGRMGLAYSSLDNPAKAKECYDRALELEPDNESYRANLQIAQEKLSQSQNRQQNPFAGLGGLGNLAAGLSGGGTGSGSGDLAGLFSNPALINMATQLMSDPSMQNMLGSLLRRVGSGEPQEASGGSEAGVEALFSAGRQLAEQMQVQHPDLVEHLRSQMGRSSNPPFQGDKGQEPPPSNPPSS